MNHRTNGKGPMLVAMSLCWSLGGGAFEVPAETEHLQRMGALEIGKPVPFFAAYQVGGEGEHYNLPKVLRDPGVKVALVFFTTFCKPCREGLLLLRDGRARLEAARVEVLLVAVGQEPEEVASYLKELKLESFIAIADRYSVIARKYGLSVVENDEERLEIPKTVVFDKKGILQDILGKEGRDYVSAIEGTPDAVVAQRPSEPTTDLAK